MSDQVYREIGQEFAEQYGTTVSQLFGKPCLKANNKAFAAFFKGDMVFKLGQQEVKLSMEQYPGSVNWDPSGKKRPMRDWLQVPAAFEENWRALAKQALDYLEESK